jgi:glycerate-2-kinase
VCPFKEEFVKTIKKEYPDIQVVEGTHPFHDVDAFKAGIKEVASQRAVTPQKMNDIVFKRIEIYTEDDHNSD